jgi:hypothetical protein
MSLLSFHSFSVANPPKPKRPCPHVSVTTPALSPLIAIRERKPSSSCCRAQNGNSDNEWNVNLWGTYVFTNTDYNPNLDVADLIQSTTEGETVAGSFDRYIGNDHAWGGGGDIKYFFHRYFGIGVEGFALNAHKRSFEIDLRPLDGIFIRRNIDDQRVVGAVLGTFTLRYPISCTRFAPHAWPESA